jgi:hypothetical protein
MGRQDPAPPRRSSALLGRRLLAQQLTRPAFAAPRDVVRWLGAVQAQDYAGVKWAVALRLSGRRIGEAAVESAIADGTILRMHVVRWTWQLVLPEDVRWMLALVAPRLVARAARRHQALELDAATFRKSNVVLERALRDGRHRTRDEIAALLGQAGISTAGERLSHLLGRAELDAIVTSGARRGKQFTYVHLDHRAPLQRAPLVREEALAELAGRYFRSRGPASLDDFIWWSGLTASDARTGLEAIRSSLVCDAVAGRMYYRSDAHAASTTSKGACHLLPAFDEYLVGYRDRAAQIDPKHVTRVNAGGGMLNPSVVVEGRVVGTWRRDLDRSGVDLEVDLFEPPAEDRQRAIHRAAKRFGEFLGLEARVKPFAPNRGSRTQR